MPKARKATDPSAPKKTTRTKKPVATATEAVENPPAATESSMSTPETRVSTPISTMTIPEARISTQTSTMSMEEQVRQRAYEIYQERGGTGGTAESDWLQAETEVLGKRTA